MQGPLVGDKGLELSQVRFYPFSIRTSQIEEIMSAGEILKDLVSGSSIASPYAAGVSSLKQRSGSTELMRAMHEQKTSSQVLDLAAAARHEASSAAPPPAATAAPLGVLPVNTTATVDGTGRQYYSLFKGPGVLTKPHVLSDTGNATGARTLADVPSFAGGGVSFSWWHKHNTREECRILHNTYCGLYFLYAKVSEGLCWSLWLEPTGIFFENKHGKHQYPRDILAEEYSLTATNSWRHITFVLDDTDDTLAYYVDGRMAWRGPWGGSVRTADCPGRAVAFGRQFPTWTHGLEVSVFDLRMYVGSALSPADVLTLASLATGPPALLPHETCTESPSVADKAWLDAMGRGCEWYYFNSKHVPGMCRLQNPAKFCPVACSSKQPCHRPATPGSELVLWDRIRMILPESGAEGAICLNDDVKMQDVLDSCLEWVREGGKGDFKDAWMTSFQHRTGRKIDFYNLTSVCDEIERAIDEHCSFSIETVKTFTSAAVQNSGDFTIAFWVRPVGPSSLTREQDSARQKFQPSVLFYSSLFPPEHNVVLGGFSLNPNGEARVHTACVGQGDRIFENVAISQPLHDDWNFIALIRRNSSKTLRFQTSVVSDANFNSEDSKPPLCLYNDTAIFNAIEVNYPMLISPILMIPEAVPIAALQRRYYASVRCVSVSRETYSCGKEKPIRVAKRPIETSIRD